MATITGLKVKFRDDFSPKLVGLVFDVDGEPRTFAAEGRASVELRIKVGQRQRWAHRAGWVDDLRTLDGQPLADFIAGKR